MRRLSGRHSVRVQLAVLVVVVLEQCVVQPQMLLVLTLALVSGNEHGDEFTQKAVAKQEHVRGWRQDELCLIDLDAGGRAARGPERRHFTSVDGPQQIAVCELVGEIPSTSEVCKLKMDFLFAVDVRG